MILFDFYFSSSAYGNKTSASTTSATTVTPSSSTSTSVTGFVFGQNLHERVAVSIYSSGCSAAVPYWHILKPMMSCIRKCQFFKSSFEIMFKSKNLHVFPRVTKVISFNRLLISIFTLFMTINAAVWEMDSSPGTPCWMGRWDW